MNPSNKLLSDIVTFRTYSKYLSNFNRRETYEEMINRQMLMHLDRFPKLSKDIIKAFQKMHEYKIAGSMRAAQFAGNAILKNNIRIFNCSFVSITYPRVFSEILYILLSGTGVGYSVQTHHVNQLPNLKGPIEVNKHVIHDSIAGWAEALQMLMDAFFYGAILPIFDYSAIRAKGTRLSTTGAKAPGPEPLKFMLEEVEKRLQRRTAQGGKLTSLEIHDLICIISDCVLAGGIRRSALISLFSRDDKDMLTCKSGEWWIKHPYRARANNSAVLPRDEVTKEEFFHIFELCQKSGAGEPGFSWTNNMEWGYNPCVTGDTEILTKTGYQQIESVVDKELEIWNGFEWSNVIPKITGIEQTILQFEFNDGRILKCTPYHKFHIAIGYTGGSRIVEAKDLIVGDKLIKHEFPILESAKELKDAYTHGFVSAEGMELNRTFYVYKPKEMCLERLQNKKIVRWEENNNRYRIILENVPQSKTFIPHGYSINSKLEWLAGLFDGDATELKEGGLQLGSVDRNFLKELQNLLSTLGIQSKVVFGIEAGSRLLPNHKGGLDYFDCKESNRICIGAVQMQSLKKLGLFCERMKFDKEPQRDASQFIKVVSIKELEQKETVYCFNEPKRHLAIFNGVITGQCHEIALQSNQFCNLTSVNQSGVKSKKDFLSRVYSAVLLGTLQASYTNFPYLSERWKTVTEKDALLGVSFTGIADFKNGIPASWLKEAAKLAKKVNEQYAKKIGINIAARIGCTKPEGSLSCVVGSSSGIHARHAQYYLRRVRMPQNEALAVYLKNLVPELVEDAISEANTVIVTIPQESPSGAILRDEESALELFQRTCSYNTHWIKPSHRSGDNMHNVSATISVKEDEWDKLKEAMWEHRDKYTGISLLPFNDSNYKQMPFETCDKETYDKYMSFLKEIDLKQVIENEDNTNHLENVACSSGVCELV